jgi:hypothetical protein
MRRTRGVVAVLILSFLALPSCSGEEARPPQAELAAGDTTYNPWCASGTQTQLCPEIPHEVNVKLPAGYSGLIPADQVRFDDFSWQSFVALNWPAGSDGRPLGTDFSASPAAPRVWEGYQDAITVFRGGEPIPCNAGGGKMLVQMAKNGQVVDPDGSFDEAVGGPLIDRNLNFVVYEKKMNPDEAQFVLDNGYATMQGQAKADSIRFPVGFYTDSAHTQGPVGSIEIKAAWMVVQPADSARFYTRAAVLYVPAKHSATGQPLCLNATVGLVGMHIIHKTRNFPSWIWSTFEHVDNAPQCLPGQGGACGDSTTFSFYNAACTNCQLNTPASSGSDSTFLWEPDPPYARRYAVDRRYGSQITRRQAVYSFTDSTSRAWQQRVQGTVWANYRLIGSQWQVRHLDVPGGGSKNVPDILRNTTLESFIPDSSSCLGCHAFASSAAKDGGGDFSFLLGMASKGLTALPPGVARRIARGGAHGGARPATRAPGDTGTAGGAPGGRDTARARDTARTRPR